MTVGVEGETAVERAIKRGLTEEDIAKQLNKTGEVPFRILNIRFEVEEGIAVPMSVINQMRRETEKWGEEREDGRGDTSRIIFSYDGACKQKNYRWRV
ncbi:DUF3656 domain-containing protein [Aminipila sp.]|uniref:DUF3656 domain-containing protein n=1 Tax=Aminipila sp. TaxID=2060095 RepID=UPI003FA41BFA